MVNHQGFTLIELMIVVAIIAILAAIAISQYQDYVIRSQISEGLSLAGGAKTAMGEFYNDHGRWPDTPGLFANASVGLAQPTSINGSYVVFTAACGEDGCGGDTDPGAVGVAFSSNGQFKANRAIGGAGLTFVPTTHAGSISWRCQRLGSGTYLQDKWLPVTCR